MVLKILIFDVILLLSYTIKFKGFAPKILTFVTGCERSICQVITTYGLSSDHIQALITTCFVGPELGRVTEFVKGKKVKSAFGPTAPSGRRLSPVSVARSDWEYFYSPLDGISVHRRITLSIKFAGTHLYTWVERGTVRVSVLAKNKT